MLADLARHAQVFDVIAARLAIIGGGNYLALFLLCVAFATATTIVLNLDTIATLAAFAAAPVEDPQKQHRRADRCQLWAYIRLANPGALNATRSAANRFVKFETASNKLAVLASQIVVIARGSAAIRALGASARNTGVSSTAIYLPPSPVKLGEPPAARACCAWNPAATTT